MGDLADPRVRLWENVDGRQVIDPGDGHDYLVGRVEVDEGKRTAKIHLYRTAGSR